MKRSTIRRALAALAAGITVTSLVVSQAACDLEMAGCQSTGTCLDSGGNDTTDAMTPDARTPGPMATLTVDDSTVEAIQNGEDPDGTNPPINIHTITIHVVTTSQNGQGRCELNSTNSTGTELVENLGDNVDRMVLVRPTEDTTYAVKCFNFGGALSDEQEEAVSVMIVKVTPALAIRQGQRVSLEYHAPDDVTSCTAGGAWHEPGPKPVPDWVEPLAYLGNASTPGLYTLTLDCKIVPGEDPASYRFSFDIAVTL